MVTCSPVRPSARFGSSAISSSPADAVISAAAKAMIVDPGSECGRGPTCGMRCVAENGRDSHGGLDLDGEPASEDVDFRKRDPRAPGSGGSAWRQGWTGPRADGG